MASSPLKIGIAGVGNVGNEVINQLMNHADYGKSFLITGISYKNNKKKRSDLFKKIKFFPNAINLAKSKNVDLVIELIGGSTGIAKDVCFNALSNKKSLITANKALIAEYGKELSELSNKNSLFIGFEGSVAGGVPVIKVIKESLICNKIIQITGILNGTSNYLMDQIEKNSLDFNVALKQAQNLGYAEKDPTFDIDGTDAAHKIAILSALVFNKLPRLSDLNIRGVSDVTLYDIKTVNNFGYKIKLLAICSNEDTYQCSVEPWLISKDHNLAKVDGVLNSIEIMSNLTGPMLLTGAGAGPKPTASAVMSDLFDYLSKSNRIGITKKNSNINYFKKVKPFKKQSKFYLRVTVIDKVGVLADLTSIFKFFKISINTIYQDLEKDKSIAKLIIFTHSVDRVQMNKAILKINKLKGIVGNSIVFGIYD